MDDDGLGVNNSGPRLLPVVCLHQSPKMSTDSPEPSRQTCRYKKSNGELCRRTIEAGESLCWQHAKTWRHKWKSLTRNQSILFIVGILSLVVSLLGLHQVFWPKQKGFMQFEKAWFNNREIQPNGRLTISALIQNDGGEPVDNVYPYFEVRLVRLGSDIASADAEIRAAFRKDAQQAHSKMLGEGKQGESVGKGHGMWSTMVMPNPPDKPFSQDQVNEITEGRLRIYVYAWARWRDAPHDLDFCQWLQPPPTTTLDNDKLFWHVCAEK